MSKFSVRITPLLALILLGMVASARAQRLSPYFGLGQLMDRAGTTNNSTVSCFSGQIFDDFTGLCENGPTLGGLFGTAGAEYMLKPHLGIDGEYVWHFREAAYLPNEGLNMRMSFYDVNAIWQPLGTRIVPFLEGGVGGARIALRFNSSGCVTGNCGTFTPPSGFSYFQLHFAGGFKIYVKGPLFVKPGFQLHYVFNMPQFGRKSVIGYTISAGYSFGKH